STSKVSPPFEQRQESAERIAQIEQHLAAQKLRRDFACVARARTLRIPISFMLAQKPARSRNGESFVVEQPLDAENHVHVFLAVQATQECSFDWLQYWEVSFQLAHNT